MKKRLWLVGILMFLLTLFISALPRTIYAAAGYQYIDRVFFAEEYFFGEDELSGRLEDQFGETWFNEGHPGIGVDCQGEDEFGPTCEQYFYLPPNSSGVSGEMYRFINVTCVVQDSCSGDLEIQVQRNDLTKGRVLEAGGGSRDITIGDPFNVRSTVEALGQEITPADTDSPDATDEETVEEENNCENAGGWGWAICPVIYIIDNALNWVDERIQDLLNVDRSYYDNDGIKRAWTNIRNIAYIILVPVLLIMVIGTALDFEFVSAYTVKRALPRLIAAVIFISLSYTICVFLIEVFEVIGRGTLGLLTLPFRETITSAESGQTITVSELSLRHLFGPTLLTSLAGAFVGAIGLLIIIWLFWGTLLLFAGTAFLVLLVRQMFIVLFLLLSPLAILSWIFPGNDKLWKTWWGSFSKLLMMFPIIMGLIAVGRIFAFILHEGRTGAVLDDVLKSLMTLAAYMIPYAFIPFTFKLAGGIFGTLTGAMQDRERGLFDRQKQKRAEKLKRAQDNHAFNERRPGWRGKVAGRANTLFSIGTSNPWSTANIYGFGRGTKHATAKGRDIMSQITQAKLLETKKMSEALQGSGISIDKGLQALAGAGEVYDAEGNRTAIGRIRNQKDLDRAVGLMSNSYMKRTNADGSEEWVEDYQTRTAAQQLSNASNFVLSAHTNPEYGRGSLEGAALMNWASQGFASKEQIADVSNSVGKYADSPTLGNLVANEASYLAYKNGGRLEMKPTYGVVAGGPDGGVTTAPPERQKELVKGLKQYEWASAKGSSINDLADPIKALVSEGGDVGYTMAQTVAANAMSATDPGSKAAWRNIAKEIFASEIPGISYDVQTRQPVVSDAALDRILYQKAYGRDPIEDTVQRSAGPPTPGAGGPL